MFLFLYEVFNMLRWCMRIFIRSFGCTANLSDGEVLAGCLSHVGHKIAETLDIADIVIYNTCAVKEPTENRMIAILKRVPRTKKLIVAGCLPLINLERLHKEVRFDGIIGPAAGDRIIEVVRRVLEGYKVFALEGAPNAKPSLKLPRLQRNPFVSIIPISCGCLGSCSYCCVVFARGRLRSHSPQEIVKRVRTDVASGIREFWLTSQDTACYGKDMNTSLASLLKALCKVKGNFRIRVGMMTPSLANDILDDLIHAFRSKRIFKFLHIPVQSGENSILKRMHRGYSVDEFRNIVNAFRSSFPRMTLATDVICGFPGESEDSFQKTVDLINEIQPDIVNVSKFFPRPRTIAAKMQAEFIHSLEIKRRSRSISKAVKKIALEKNHTWIGWTGKVFVDEAGGIPGSCIARNFAYKPVVLKDTNSANIIGKTLNVEITKAHSTYLQGKMIE